LGIDGDSIKAKGIEYRCSILSSAIPNVTVLRISDDWDLLGNVLPGLFHSNKPFNPQSLVESKIGFIGAHQVLCGIDDVSVKLEHIDFGHQPGIGIEPDTE